MDKEKRKRRRKLRLQKTFAAEERKRNAEHSRFFSRKRKRSPSPLPAVIPPPVEESRSLTLDDFVSIVTEHQPLVVAKSEAVLSQDTSWCAKYAPKTLAEVCIDKRLKTRVKTWFDVRVAHKRGTKKALLLIGPPGIGKRALVHLLAAKSGLEVEEPDAVDTYGKLLDQVRNGPMSCTLGGEAVWLFSGVDGYSTQKDDIGAAMTSLRKVVDLLTTTKRRVAPLIFTIHDFSTKTARLFRTSAFEEVEISEVDGVKAEDVLRFIAQREGCPTLVEPVMKEFSGDIRQSILSLQLAASAGVGGTGATDHLTSNVFDSTRFILNHRRTLSLALLSAIFARHNNTLQYLHCNYLEGTSRRSRRVYQKDEAADDVTMMGCISEMADAWVTYDLNTTWRHNRKPTGIMMAMARGVALAKIRQARERLRAVVPAGRLKYTREDRSGAMKAIARDLSAGCSAYFQLSNLEMIERMELINLSAKKRRPLETFTKEDLSSGQFYCREPERALSDPFYAAFGMTRKDAAKVSPFMTEEDDIDPLLPEPEIDDDVIVQKPTCLQTAPPLLLDLPDTLDDDDDGPIETADVMTIDIPLLHNSC